MHFNHRLSICESVLQKLTHVGVLPLNRANGPYIVPSIYSKEHTDFFFFVNKMKIYTSLGERYFFSFTLPVKCRDLSAERGCTGLSKVLESGL